VTDHDQQGVSTRVDHVFGALSQMTDADLMTMSGAWTGEDAALRELAWTKVRATAKRDPRSKVLVESRDRLARWVNDVGITWAGAYERSIVVPVGVDQGNLRRNPVPPILDAVVATLFDDALTDEERDVLLEPLRRVTEPRPNDE